MRFKPEYGSHLPVLLQALALTTGDVLELGGGYMSTPVLHWVCVSQGRSLLTLENDQGCYEMLKPFRHRLHRVELVADWDDALIDGSWDVALIDHAPGARRRHDIKRLANQAQILIVHDTEPGQDTHYGYFKDRTFERFKHRYDDTSALPWTTVLSNFMSLALFVK